jgi:hypothetical protein
VAVTARESGVPGVLPRGAVLVAREAILVCVPCGAGPGEEAGREGATRGNKPPTLPLGLC